MRLHGYAKCGCPIYDEGCRHNSDCANIKRDIKSKGKGKKPLVLALMMLGLLILILQAITSADSAKPFWIFLAVGWVLGVLVGLFAKGGE